MSCLSCVFARAGVALRGVFQTAPLLVRCVEFPPPAFKQSQPVLRNAEILGVRDWRGKGSIGELSRHTSGFPCEFAKCKLHPMKQTAGDMECFP